MANLDSILYYKCQQLIFMESAGRTYVDSKGMASEGIGFPRAGSANVIIVKNNV